MSDAATRRGPRPRRPAPTTDGPLMTADALENLLWDSPGLSDAEITKGMDDAQRLHFTRLVDAMIAESRIGVMRFTSNAPMLRTTFRYFAPARCKVEILAADGESMAHVHDPLGTWQASMDGYIQED